jgi:indole-3-glycerol phosphate synthase
MSANVLPAVLAAARRSALERERAASPGAIDRAASARSPRGVAFHNALCEPGVRIIAECKRRSPSRGVLAAAYDPATIAQGYAAAGAAAVSVLTEPTFFDGSLDDLSAVRAAVAIPVLRKDFIVTPFQVAEARAIGADAVLLIVAALGDQELAALVAQAASLDLAAVIEVHDREELRRAEAAGASIVGVNARDLRSLQIHPRVFDDLAGLVAPNVVTIAESGITSAAEVQRLRALGYDAFLIGEHFMVQPDPGAALAALGGAIGSSGER